MANPSITSVKGVRVGQASSRENLTGTTVVLFDHPALTVVDVRGGWPGTFDTDSLRTGMTFLSKHAVFLTGGDVFGLNAAAGIQRYLLGHGASDHLPSDLPGVVGANIYDLEFGKKLDRVDYAGLGHAACMNASRKPVRQGNFGAGTGATVGKLLGMEHAMKGGVGSSVAEVSGKFRIGAVVVVNAVGNVFDRQGVTVAGTRKGGRARGFVELEDMAEDLARSGLKEKPSPRATTIGVVATDLDLSHGELTRIATMAHDGIARCVRPAHGATDGDALFCSSTARVQTPRLGLEQITLMGELAAIQVQKSILSGVFHARSLAGIPSSG